jgi:hypothetical protein
VGQRVPTTHAGYVAPIVKRAGTGREDEAGPACEDAMSEQTYDDGRAKNLEQMLRVLAERIRELDAQQLLLGRAPELMQLLGEIRSELFHYEVRATYDTPEIAEHRRLVDDARTTDDANWEPTTWRPDQEEESEW